MNDLKNYPGNKNINGLWQFIINRIPPHDIFFELFAGSGTIGKKLPGTRKVFADIDPKVIQALKKHGSVTDHYFCMDALQLLSSLGSMEDLHTIATVLASLQEVKARNNCARLALKTDVTVRTRVMIYCDPPYLFSSRRSKRKLYRCEMGKTHDHELFLKLCSTVKHYCMISHPENDLYDEYLKGWNKEKFKVSNHGHVAEECIYYNYDKPSLLQTYDYVGSDCWDRQRVKRKIVRLAKKLSQLPALERNAVIDRAIK